MLRVTNDTRYAKELNLTGEPHSLIVVLEEDRAVAGAVLVKNDFDRQIFSKNVYDLKQLTIKTNTPSVLQEMMSYIDTQIQPDVVKYKADILESNKIQLLERAGFFIAGISITLACDADQIAWSDPTPNYTIRIAQAADITALRACSVGVFCHAHFYHNPVFSHEDVDALYGAWIENAVNGRADRVYVATNGREIFGYLAVKLDNDNTGIIDLVAVKHRNKGVGTALTETACSYLAGKCNTIRVTTEAGNYAALRLYQKFNFRIVGTTLNLHRNRLL